MAAVHSAQEALAVVASGPTAGSSSSGGCPQAGGTTSAGGSGGVPSTAGSGGVPSTGGSTSGVCRPKFASGVNVAWFKFASDIPSPQIDKFTALFKNVKAAGGSAVRWWFHTNGMVTPGYDASGKAKPISAENIADLKKILDAAKAEGVGLVISIWSFGMLDSGQTSDATVLANNKLLLENDGNRQAYIDNVLTPMVTALKAYPGLYAWEIFNEPEGMSSDNGGWTTPAASRTLTVNLQKTDELVHERDSRRRSSRARHQQCQQFRDAVAVARQESLVGLGVDHCRRQGKRHARFLPGPLLQHLLWRERQQPVLAPRELLGTR